MSRVCDSINTRNNNGVVIGDTATSSYSTIISTATASRNIQLPDASDTLVGKNTVDNFTNKTITATSNNVAARSLVTTTGIVDGSASNAPIVGQVPTATSASTFTWQTPTIPGTTNTTGTVTTTNVTPTLIETIATVDGTVYYVTTLVAAKSTTNGAGYTVKRAYRRGTGVATLTAISIDDIVSHETDTTWSVNTNANTTTGNIEIQVTGVAATTINWKSATTTVSL